MKEQIAELVGKQAEYGCGGLSFAVTISDVKQAYGETRVAIVPLSGSGIKWVNLDSVKLSPPNY